MGFVSLEARRRRWRSRNASRLIAMFGHAAVINRYRVLSWSEDRRLVVYRKVALNFVLADRLIDRKLFFVERSPIDGDKVLWERCAARRRKAQDCAK
jgi:hypothetical protein